MNTAIPNKVRLGTRFTLKNALHEVTWIAAASIRYASCEGGRPYTVPVETFWSLVDEGLIGFAEDATGIAGDTLALWQLSAASKREVEVRLAFVNAAMRARRKFCSITNIERVRREFSNSMPASEIPSRATIARWIKAYINSGCQPSSLAPLHFRKGPRLKRLSLQTEMTISWALQNDYLSDLRNSVEQIRCNIVGRLLNDSATDEAVELPSSRTIYRRAKELDPFIVAYKRYGRRFAEKVCKAAGTSFEASRPMESVMIDGHVMDLIVVDSDSGEPLGRPRLVCTFDVCTRAVTGWHISMMPFCATSALAAIKHMCTRDPLRMPGGIPESIIPDNGRDLVSTALQAFCKALGIHFRPAKAYCPDDKAVLERFFRTVNLGLVHMLSGTTFSSPNDRGDYDSTKHAKLTLHEINQLFNKWLTEVYEVKIHPATKRAPKLHWRDQQSVMPISSISTADADVLARISYTRLISNGRVMVGNLEYKSHALATLEQRGQREVTVLVNELDLGFVYIQRREDPQLLIKADGVRTEYTTGLTKYEHDEVQKQLKALSQKDRIELGLHAYEIGRWRLWQDIHKLNDSKSRRRLKTLLAGTANSALMDIEIPTQETLQSASGQKTKGTKKSQASHLDKISELNGKVDALKREQIDRDSDEFGGFQVYER